LGYVLEKGWLTTFPPFLPFTLYLVIPRFLKNWPSSAMFIKMCFSPYGFLESPGVIILQLVTIEEYYVYIGQDPNNNLMRI
jgi:hypothetical protein